MHTLYAAAQPKLYKYSMYIHMYVSVCVWKTARGKELPAFFMLITRPKDIWMFSSWPLSSIEDFSGFPSIHNPFKDAAFAP